MRIFDFFFKKEIKKFNERMKKKKKYELRILHKKMIKNKIN